MSDPGINQSPPHVALLPSSGMGHLIPMLRLADLLIKHDCRVTLITSHPTVSLSESQLISRFLSSFPQITPKELHLLPFDPTTANSKDPFTLQFEAIRRSARLLSPLLSSSSPPLSALITDISLFSAFIPITKALCLPNYILFISSANMLSFCAYYPTIVDSKSSNASDKFSETIPIPAHPIPKSWIPSVLLDQNTLFATQFIENGRKIIESNGILINTFDGLEAELVTALNGGKVVNGLPPLIPIGPLEPCDFERGPRLDWLDDQPENSVVYVSFGNRSAMSREQIRELGVGLLLSGCRFVWVVKDKIVDKEDEAKVEEVVGDGFMEKVKDKGLVVKTWVDQGEILSHPAVGGFLSQSGWNSITEAAWYGVRMLAWPFGGDQMINAEVVEKSGLGVWVQNWGWCGEKVVCGEEIGVKIREMMENEGLRLQAAHIREEAREAKGVDGSSEKALTGVIEVWNKFG